MTNFKDKIFLIFKLLFITIFFLTIFLFFYAAFFYEQPEANKENYETKIIEEEQKTETYEESEENKIIEEQTKLDEEKIQEKINESIQEKTKIKEIKTVIKDGLFMTIGNKAITKLDIVNEIKKILILNNMSYSDDRRDELHQLAIKAIVKRSIKQIEIEKNSFLKFNQKDLNHELNALAARLNMDLQTLKNVCESNGLDFTNIENQLKTSLLWNSLIFYLYANRISINQEEIEEQLISSQNKKEIKEYLISEIVIEPIAEDKLELKIQEIKNKIKNESFESVAMNLSISQTAEKGGDLGWVSENIISDKFKSQISKTSIGEVSEPLFIPDGILFFEVRDVRISRDKKWWYFRSNQVHPGELHLYRMKIQGGKWEKVTSMVGNNETWLSPDEKFIAIRHSYSNRPWDLFLMKNKIGSQIIRLTKSQTDDWNSYPWRVPDIITFKAEDGAKVYGRIYLPDKQKNSGAAVIFVHGAGYLQNVHKILLNNMVY